MAPSIKRHDILILQTGKDIPGDLREMIKSRGLRSQTIRNHTEIGGAAQALEEPILLVHCGEGRSDVGTIIAQLSESDDAHLYPIIVVGVDVDRFESFLNQHFTLATTLTLPASNGEILEAITFVTRYYEKFKRELSDSQKGAEDGSAFIITNEELQPSEVHTLYEHFDSIPEMVVQKLIELNLLKVNLAGASYATMNTISELPGMISPSPKTSGYRAADALLQNSPVKIRSRMIRIAILSSTMANALQISPSYSEETKISALLYGWGIGRDLFTRDYSGFDGAEIRQSLCSRIKDSAMHVATELKLATTSSVIATIARLIGREVTVSDTEEDITASIIVGADLIDRICYRNGFFETAAAYSLLSKIKSSRIREIHPLVICCVIKLLAEAISSAASNLTVSKRARRTPEALELARQAHEGVIGPDEIRVAITALSPGMKLSRPVHTYDGREVLKEDLTLDDDLIWRIWQLSSIRPLSGPLIVYSEVSNPGKWDA